MTRRARLQADPLPTDGWMVIPYACRECGRRIGQRGDLFACLSCEARTIGGSEPICECGLGGKRAAGRFRCIANPAPSPSSPAAIVIAFAQPDTGNAP